MSTKLRIAYQRYTSCGGCQLTFLNCERELSLVGKSFEVVDFQLLSSVNARDSFLDVALVEGAIVTQEELLRLLALRRRAKFLIAVGACALSAGVNALAKKREVQMVDVYDASTLPGDSFPPQPVAHFVSIDAQLPGCPPEGHDYLQLLGALLQGGLPPAYSVAVCMECRLRENSCLLIEGQQPCMGPVTRGGCLARCPSYGVICEGCRGAAVEANFPEQVKLLLQTGLTAAEVHGRLERFLRRDDEGH